MGLGYLRRSRPASLALALALLAGKPIHAEMADYILDPEHLSITFFVHHLGFADVAGMFLEAEGSFRYDEASQQLEDLRVVIKTDSVFTNHEGRDGHLRGADFLNVEEFPEMIFEGRSSRALSDSAGAISGDLTLLGVTRPVSLEVVMNKAGRYPFGDQHFAIGIDATGTFRRSDFGMTYGVEGDWVGDEVRLVIGLEAIRQE